MRSSNHFSALYMLIVCGLAGCGDSITGDEIIPAVIDVSVTPQTIQAAPSSNSDFEWQATFTITFVETAGTGATISSVNAVITETSSGITVVSETEEIYQVSVDSDTNLIPANGFTEVGFTVSYTLPGGGTEAIVDVSTSIVDDNGLEVGGPFAVAIQ